MQGSIIIEMPKGAHILCVQMQHEIPCIWAKVDTDLPMEPRYFTVKGTGHQIEVTEKLDYIGTFQILGSALIWHLFEEIKENMKGIKMTKKRKQLFKRLAKQSLKKRWLPIFEAKSIEEIKRIENTAACNFCACDDIEDCCSCPIGNKKENKCNDYWYDFYEALLKEDLTKAHLYTGKIVILLQEIADWGC